MEQQDVLQQLAAAMLQQMQAGGANRYKAVSSTPTTTYGHGPGGLFSSPALERPIYSAMVLPSAGLASMLPAFPSNSTNPLYGIFTGVTATSGSEPEGVCDDPPTAGLSKLCMHQFVFGRYSRQTRVFDIDRVGRVTDRGEHLDFQFYGNPTEGLGGNSGPFLPTLPGPAAIGNAANNEIAKALFEVGVAWSRDFARQTYSGNPTNNTAGGGYKEFYGLDSLINTGYRDAETGVACPAADSLVMSFANQNISTGGATVAAAIVKQMTWMYRLVQNIAGRANLMPARWAFAMPFSLFYEIVNIWPVTYSTYRTAAITPTGATTFVSADVELRMRDEMLGDMTNRTGQYLLIDGQKVPVVIDDAISETELTSGQFSADIYLVPLTVLGGRPVTYWEYFNYNMAGGPLEMARAIAPDGSYYTTDNGRFMWHKKPPTLWCVQAVAKMEPRLLLLTPYIAARLTDVRYTPLQHERSAFTDSSYFTNGGSTSQANAPSYYSPTA
jgi:hypothetical protein